MKTKIKNMTLQELEQYFVSMGEKKYRAKQVFSWMYKGAFAFDEMTDLPVALRTRLMEVAEIEQMIPERIQSSQKDGTRKYLFRLQDGELIESVFMKYDYGNSICISSQAGCRMGCRFCASTLLGLERNLTAAEMIDQILIIEKDTGELCSNVVVMGTGEPFDNYENLSRFLTLIHAEEGKHLGWRSITVSTCGIVPRFQQFGEDFPQVSLAVSLHAPNDELRTEIMPINRTYGIGTVLNAAKEYVKLTGRRITFEYALMSGLNDRKEDAIELADKLRGMNCHVNLIPLNTVQEASFQGTKRREAEQFRQNLESRGIVATVRRELGGDIDAACGQLRLGARV